MIMDGLIMFFFCNFGSIKFPGIKETVEGWMELIRKINSNGWIKMMKSMDGLKRLIIPDGSIIIMDGWSMYGLRRKVMATNRLRGNLMNEFGWMREERNLWLNEWVN